MCFIVSPIWSTIRPIEGSATRALSPCRISISPIVSSDCIASRIAGLPTPSRSISSRSEGNASPNPIAPLRITSRSRPRTSSDSFRFRGGA